MTLYEGPIFRVERRDGRDVVVHAPVAAVVAVDLDGLLNLVRQRRVPVDASLLELPAGSSTTASRRSRRPAASSRRRPVCTAASGRS